LQPRTIVVLQGGSALELRPFVDQVPALLMAWYPGMLGGEALADVLFGEVCPSGKLPVSFARSARDLVSFDARSKRVHYGYDHGYRHLDRVGREPEFPFGFGLSYTQFRYDALTLAREVLSPDEELSVLVQVTNVGARAGEEVVQLYLSAENQPQRPPRALVGFGRLALAPGQSRRLRMRLTPRELGCFDVERGAWGVPRGAYTLRAGPSSRALPLSATFVVA
jgi:beta-glucosidase